MFGDNLQRISRVQGLVCCQWKDKCILYHIQIQNQIKPFLGAESHTMIQKNFREPQSTSQNKKARIQGLIFIILHFFLVQEHMENNKKKIEDGEQCATYVDIYSMPYKASRAAILQTIASDCEDIANS